ncbi:tegument protein VP22 [Bovine alphaherpesvirus 2]|uniref:Tegument protein VP22 n=1 Tax=Bovine alphaherpesvirus 2 TaxID=10295 RepID=A0ABX6WMJ2_9ALPH|nr:tegument protein VP22 [Bovine alphaherpesvirus 2]QPO25182.1 tegument protein VP22 [Bovine alphaherpesvirus 2]
MSHSYPDDLRGLLPRSAPNARPEEPRRQTRRRWQLNNRDEDWLMYSGSSNTSSDEEELQVVPDVFTTSRGRTAACMRRAPGEPRRAGAGVATVDRDRAQTARQTPAARHPLSARQTPAARYPLSARQTPTTNPPRLNRQNAMPEVRQRSAPPMFVVPAEPQMSSLRFSTAPVGPTAPWAASVSVFNKRVYCSAVGRIAATHARRAAARLWETAHPRSDEELSDLLDATNIRVTVCEGSNLIARANELIPPPHTGGRTSTGSRNHAV